ncbi:hypothetical protein [Streptomyces xantholiticus]|uniref:Uncharacterized protein n=1 Tax=Streptomyces xantholiticus TaxID=68285 RepID=A0ABV1V197_9ACTN
MKAAAMAFTSAVQSLAGQVFPWASTMKVRHEWSYAWHDESDAIALPTTDKNTPKPPK